MSASGPSGPLVFIFEWPLQAGFTNVGAYNHLCPSYGFDMFCQSMAAMI